jgi:pheromone shutdown protein TraB
MSPTINTSPTSELTPQDTCASCACACDQELTPALIEASKEDDAITAATAQLAATYPALVHERDLYLAWSCKRSKAVNGTRQVVGVVGKGHLRGVVYALKHDKGTLRFADLVGGKNTRAAKQAAAAAAWRRLGVELLLGVGLAAAWQVWSSSSGGALGQ